jgi:predicted lipid-binding transport protein (Tim44 family)
MQLSALLEVIIFALIAFVIISKMLNILGDVNEEDVKSSKSFFGEAINPIKTVTGSRLKSSEKLKIVNGLAKKIQASAERYKDFVLTDGSTPAIKIIDGLEALSVKMPSFDIAKFIENATKALYMSNESIRSSKFEVLNYIVDKRFISKIKSSQHESLRNLDLNLLSAKVCEVYSFGNNMFIKVLFEMSNNIKEEWAFSKNLLETNPVWYICSIDSVSL